MCQYKKIDSIEAFIKQTKNDYQKWELGESPWLPWFRGEPTCDKPLLPKLYRGEYEDESYENRLLQFFRMKAPSLGYGKMPDREYTDQWIFMAQHVGFPTRLLDWTEGSLIALYFALQEEKPVVWMLNPFELNRLSTLSDTSDKPYNIYALTWYKPEDGSINIGYENIRSAWELDSGRLDLPVAVHPTNVHPRMTAQRSCFTVHGKKKKSLYKLLSQNYPEKDILTRYEIDGNKSKEMLDELRILGVSRATMFPEPVGLAKDLTELFRPDLAEGVK